MLKPILLATASAMMLCFSLAVFAADAEAGKAIYAEKGCVACHGADGHSINKEQFPSLAGQGANYIAEQLHNFKDGSRKGEGPGVIMNQVTKTLSNSEIENIAAYIASLE